MPTVKQIKRSKAYKNIQNLKPFLVDKNMEDQSGISTKGMRIAISSLVKLVDQLIEDKEK